MKVKDLMNEPVKIEKDISLAEAAKIMCEKKTGSLLFISKDKIRGIVTERDILKNFGKYKNISSVMSPNIITIDPKADVNDALTVMKDNQIKRLPVIKEGKIIGIISLTDIAAHVDELDSDFFF